ncbi:radical SAM protein [bacterium]|nr:radical SAM protein [candidate division CSSED10-310 bacterium]
MSKSGVKVLLVRQRLTENLALMPPIGLGFMATSLRRAGCSVRIADCILHDLAPAQLARQVAEWRPDVVGLSTISRELSEVNRELAAIKQRVPATVVVVGGPHVSGVGAAALTHFPAADYGLAGEGELAFTELVNGVASGVASPAAIPGGIWLEGGVVKVLPPARIMDLDSIGMPAWDLIPPRTYPDSPTTVFVRRLPTAPIQISRGCLYPCRFCASKGIYGQHFRYRSPAAVIEEMGLLIKDHGVREFQVIDDNLFQQPDMVRAFCEELLAADLRTLWTLPNGARLDLVDEELARLLLRSGCYRVSVGVDSGSPRILAAMNKRLDKELLIHKIKMMRRLGMEVLGHFIIGYPGETEADIRATLALAMRLPLNFAGFSHFAPVPGSDHGAACLADEQQDPACFERTSFYAPQASHTPHVDLARLIRFKQQAYLRFYTRPSVLWHIIRRVHRGSHLTSVFARIAYLLRQD